MTKQEFSIRLLYFLMPYPLSKKLPSMFHRLFRGPSAEVPSQWAQSAFVVIYSILADVVATAESLLAVISDLPPTEQLASYAADLRAAIEASQQSLSLLSDIVSDLGSYTPEQIVDSFVEVTSSIDEIIDISDAAPDLVPIPPIPVPPVEKDPFPPVYGGPPVPGPGALSSPPRQRPHLKAVWFLDTFDIIDPAVWTDYSGGTGVCSIVNNELKMLSSAPGSYAYLVTTSDNTIPETFRFSFNLNIASGTGKFQFEILTGVHVLSVIFQAPNTLRFRRKQPAGYIDIDVGNFMGTSFLWKFFYDGTLCTIYKSYILIASDLTIHQAPANKGKRTLITEDVLTTYLDNYRIIYPV